jgi:hypothetical protein
MLKCACPSCDHPSEWPDDWGGEKVDCPSCHRPMKLAHPRRGRDEDEDEGRDERLEVTRRRFRDEEDDRDYRDDRPGRRGRIVCMGCDYRGRPEILKVMSETAWVLIVIGLFFWPLIIVGALMRDTWEVCPECGRRIRKVGSSFGG